MKNNNHASKALAVVLSGALAFAPAANAALDESDMAFTSAAEGFYGSLRVQYANNESGGKDNDSTVEGSFSRLGVRGDVDLGGGLEAFYGFEWNLGTPANGADDLNTRQYHVGLKGDWGSIFLGAFDSVIVRFGGFGTTDLLPQYSGNFEPIYRTENGVAYVSPDLNGFQFGIEAQANDGKKTTPYPGGKVNLTTTDDDGNTTATSIDAGSILNEDGEAVTNQDDGNDFDKIGLGASYAIQGLTFSGAYYQVQDALSVNSKAVDSSQYALGIKYSQDNWVVAAMYGDKDAANDAKTKEIDSPFLSFVAGVSIDKFDFHGLWEQQSFEKFFGSKDKDQTIAALSAVYNLGSKASLRANWKNTETDMKTGSATDDTSYALGMKVDF